MNRLQYIVIHCLLTPKGRWISKGDIEMWHKGPRDLLNGKVRFLGRDYNSREELPMVKINGVWVSKLHGRGWDRLGYADMIHHNGEIQNLTPYNEDDFVDSSEMTWGAVGINSISRHVALEGGIHPKSGELNGIWPFEELYSDEQFVMLAGYIKQAIVDYPWIEIIGHNQVPGSGKTCPNFDVLQFCHNIGVKAKNVGLNV
jgi:N-acetylmuramoyl-L-alanine amidase